MRRFWRRTISIIMSVITVLSCFAELTFSVGAQTSGDYEYEVLDDGTVSITKYNGSDINVTIPSKIDGVSVTVIGINAFSYNKKIESVIIPNGVVRIEYHAFAKCTNLLSVDISDSVISIGKTAFSECTNLLNVKMSKKVVNIGESAFYNCSSLIDIHIPSGVTKIEKSVFFGCGNLKDVIIPDGVISIENHAFCNCNDLKNIAIPNSVTSIKSGAFAFCRNLESVDMSNSIKFMEDEVFYGCSSLKEVSIPTNIDSISDGMFYKCESLENITIPNNITKIGSYSFSQCRKIKKIIIPESITVIGDKAFNECSGLTEIEIPRSITNIKMSTFYRCSELEKVIIPDTVTTIGDFAFLECEKLKKIVIPKSVLSIGAYAFGFNQDKESIADFTIYGYAGTAAEKYATENGFKFIEVDSEIEPSAEYEYISLADGTAKITKYNGLDSNVEIPSVIGDCTVVSIGYEAFYNNDRITDVIIPDSVSEIGDSAFLGCVNLRSIEISNNLYSIGLHAFDHCESLENIYIPETVENIGTGAFWNCKNLTTVNIPKMVTKIDENVFLSCEKLTICCSKGSAADIIYYSDLEKTKEIPVKYRTDVSSAEKCIAVFSTERSLRINPGGSFNLGFGITDGEAVDFDSEWKQMSLSVGDPSVISVSDYVKTDCGYCVTITGLKEGKSSVTVTDTDSGANMVIEITVSDDYIKTYSYKIDKMREFYPDNNRENHLLTNIYNQNGLYVNNYKCKKESGKYHVTFDVYNETYYAGAVDIYDKNGLWQGYCEIKKNHDISSLKDTIDQTYYLISDYINKKLITYAQRGSSEYTNIDIYIPEGGYFTISNNMLTSPGTYLTNAFEIVFDAATSALSLILSDSVKTSALSDFKKEMGKDFTQKLIDTVNEQKSEAKKKAMQKVMLGSMQDKIKEITKNYANTSLKDMATQSGKMFSDISVWAENVFNSYEINWKGLYSAATGISESLFTKFAGFPGLALDAYFSFSKGTQKIAMAYQMARSLNVPYSIIYSSFDDGYVTPDNVIVHTDGNIDSDAVLQVFKIGSDDTIDAILNSDDPLEAYEIYNISFVKNDTLVQPNGKVKVYLPIPDGMAGNTCKVYRRESDGTWTVLDAYIEGSYLVFETDHFSVYALVGSRDNLVITSPAKKTEYEYGETLDTSGLVLSYAGEEIKRGYICSPSVLIGSGEQEITVAFGLAQTKFTVTVNKENSNDEGLKFIDSDTDGIIDETGGKVYIYPKNIGGITVYEFKSLFENEIKVNLDDGENAFNGMAFMSENHEYILIIKGDTQANGKINASDARIILRIAARLEQPDDVTKDAADVNSDGKVTSKEARLVLRFAAKLQSKIYE